MMRPERIWIMATATIVLTGCTATRIQLADQAYDLMQYPRAERLYEKVLAHREDRTVRARLADAYRRHNAWDESLKHYRILHGARPLSGDTALHFGEVLRAAGEQDEAADLILHVLQQTPEDRYAMDLFSSTQGYRSFYEDSARFFVNRINIPGVATAIAGIPYKDGLLFVGEKEADVRSGNPWNGNSFMDLYHTTSKTEVTWLPAQLIRGKVNGAFHEGPATISPDGRTLYFTRSNYAHRKLLKDERNTSQLMLFRAHLDSTGAWNDLHAFKYNGDHWSTGHPALSTDGRTLYFASDRPGGFGGSDIWLCRDNGNGWSEPENLGAVINTPGNEVFPTINGNTLHFASTGHLNMGGLDIFETQLIDGKWTDPVNLLAPINSPKDDLHFVMDSTGKAGFLSSDRDGSDQIYAFTLYEPLFDLLGLAMDDEGNYLADVTLTLTDRSTEEDLSTLSGPNGAFTFKLKPNRDYILRGTRDDMLTTSQHVSTKGLTRLDSVLAPLRLTRLRLGEAIAINNIYYDYDSWEIRYDAALELDKLARLFIENPKMSFELGSHTDSRGGDLYNLVLSDARANAAVNYLIQRGVDPDRITAKGYGEDRLVNGCSNGVHCTEAEHQANRRTEFTVTGVASIAETHSRP